MGNNMERIIVASKNSGKIREIGEIFKDKFEIVPMKDVGFDEDIEETGNTFFENSYIKASYIAKKINENVLADDSGLCVDFLNGAPGVFSARYGGEHGNDKDNIKKLLKELEGVEERNAKFCSSVVLFKKDGTHLEGFGETFGRILYKEEGTHGFGYDPIFYSYDLQKSFGLATEEEKNSVSHRYRALVDLYKKLGL